MKKTVFVTLILLAGIVAGFAAKPYKVLFYNVENLFDTINDPSVNDEEFTPHSAKKWNSSKYYKKLGNIERVIFDVAAIDKDYPAVIGVCEVENRNVLEDIVAMPKIAPASYRIVHYDSPERRGVDVALLYRPDQFELEGSEAVRTIIPSIPDFKTRDILTAWGKIEGEPFFFMVVHWSSRSGGQAKSEFLRVASATQMRGIADSVLRANPATKIVMMGDFNDDPTDKSMIEALQAQGDIDELEQGDLFNPFFEIHRAGYGTLAYRDKWNLFDNIVVSENLATGSTGELELQKADKSKFYGSIFKRRYMILDEGSFRGYPKRTFVGNNFQGGFSDHLPVYINIGK